MLPEGDLGVVPRGHSPPLSAATMTTESEQRDPSGAAAICCPVGRSAEALGRTVLPSPQHAPPTLPTAESGSPWDDIVESARSLAAWLNHSPLQRGRPQHQTEPRHSLAALLAHRWLLALLACLSASAAESRLDGSNSTSASTRLVACLSADWRRDSRLANCPPSDSCWSSLAAEGAPR
eukprot:6066366-Prymnesium_polylepis.1